MEIVDDPHFPKDGEAAALEVEIRKLTDIELPIFNNTRMLDEIDRLRAAGRPTQAQCALVGHGVTTKRGPLESDEAGRALIERHAATCLGPGH